jgi:iron complex transport system permease protein
MRSLQQAYLLNFSLLGAALVLSVAFGAVAIPPATLVRILSSRLGAEVLPSNWPETFDTIVYQIRLPHAVLMALTGAALGGSGAAYQGLFRNPLADPYLIGVASGAGLGAVLAITFAASLPLFGLFTVPAAAFVGAVATVLVVYALARGGKTGLSGSGAPTTILILAGVAVGSFASSLTSFLMLSTQGEVRRALAWLLGGYTLGGWAPVWVILPYLGVGLAALLTFGHPLNVLQFGDEQAQQLGLPVERTRSLVILAASLTTAAAVSFSGIIGFIGLIVPHLARLVWGVDYRHLIPLSILGGATCLLVADLLSRLVLAPQEVPVGILTALAGAPFFLWVLRRSQRAAVRE